MKGEIFKMNILKPKVRFDRIKNILVGIDVKHYKKYLKDVLHLYADADVSIYNHETIMYEVYSYGEGDEDKQGNLLYGLTVMYPVYIKNECNMTQGHFHVDKNCAEYYFGIEGEGLLLLMNEQREMYVEKVFPGSIHYIDGKYAHRLVNIGDSVFKVAACWPTTAGHDYEAVRKGEFPYRVYKINGKIEFVKR